MIETGMTLLAGFTLGVGLMLVIFIGLETDYVTAEYSVTPRFIRAIAKKGQAFPTRTELRNHQQDSEEVKSEY